MFLLTPSVRQVARMLSQCRKSDNIVIHISWLSLFTLSMRLDNLLLPMRISLILLYYNCSMADFCDTLPMESRHAGRMKGV